MTFEDLFRIATSTESNPRGVDPYPYQTQFAADAELPSMLNVPTGAGKTATCNPAPAGALPADAVALAADLPQKQDRLIRCH